MRYQPTLAVEERKEVMANAFRRLDRSSEIHLRLSLEFEGRIYLLSKNPGALEFEVRILQAGRPQLVCNFRDFYSRVFFTVYRGRVCVLGYWLWSFTEDNFFRVKNVCHPVIDATTNPPTIVAQYMEEIFRYADWIGDDILRRSSPLRCRNIYVPLSLIITVD